MKRTLWLRRSQRKLLHFGTNAVRLRLYQQDYAQDVLLPLYRAKHGYLLNFSGFCLRVVRSKEALETGYSSIVWIENDNVLSFRAVHVFNCTPSASTDIERDLVDLSNIRYLDLPDLRWLKNATKHGCYKDMQPYPELVEKVNHVYSRMMAVLYPITVNPSNRIWRK